MINILHVQVYSGRIASSLPNQIHYAPVQVKFWANLLHFSFHNASTWIAFLMVIVMETIMFCFDTLMICSENVLSHVLVQTRLFNTLLDEYLCVSKYCFVLSVTFNDYIG